MDLRIEHIFQEEMKEDKSFQEKESGLSLLFGSKKYSKEEMKETFYSGVKVGIEIGLRRASLEGQKIELTQNTFYGTPYTPKTKHQEFLTKFYKLAEEYNCAIQYHLEHGMTVIDLNIPSSLKPSL